MSTKADRAARAKRFVLPIKVRVRQNDGTIIVQIVDADVRADKRSVRADKRSGRKVAS